MFNWIWFVFWRRSRLCFLFTPFTALPICSPPLCIQRKGGRYLGSEWVVCNKEARNSGFAAGNLCKSIEYLHDLERSCGRVGADLKGCWSGVGVVYKLLVELKHRKRTNWGDFKSNVTFQSWHVQVVKSSVLTNIPISGWEKVPASQKFSVSTIVYYRLLSY